MSPEKYWHVMQWTQVHEYIPIYFPVCSVYSFGVGLTVSLDSDPLRNTQVVSVLNKEGAAA